MKKGGKLQSYMHSQNTDTVYYLYSLLDRIAFKNKMRTRIYTSYWKKREPKYHLITQQRQIRDRNSR